MKKCKVFHPSLQPLGFYASHSEQKIKTEMQLSKKRKQVGLLGGNFNPIHQAHLIIADQVQQQLGLDRVFLMPSYESPHKDPKKTISSEYRLEMLQLAIANNPTIGIEPMELTRGGKSYSYDTLVSLKEQNPDTDYYFIIGEDMVESLPTWYRINELIQMVQFVGVKRPGNFLPSDYSILWVDVPLMDISSTVIRKKIHMGCSVRYLLPENVIDYIHTKGLYLDDNE